MNASRLYVVIPWFNESTVVDEMVPRFLAALAELMEAGKVEPASKLLFVDDGSSDGTLNRLQGWSARRAEIEVLALEHNMGQQPAIVEGLKLARARGADAVVTMDCDGQDDPGAIKQMVGAFLAGDQVVYGVRNDRSSDTFLKRNTSLAFYSIMKMLGSKAVYNHAEFRLMSAEVVDAMVSRWHEGVFLRALAPRLGFRGSVVEYRRMARVGGESHYTYWALFKWAASAIKEAVWKRR